MSALRDDFESTSLNGGAAYEENNKKARELLEQSWPKWSETYTKYALISIIGLLLILLLRNHPSPVQEVCPKAYPAVTALSKLCWVEHIIENSCKVYSQKGQDGIIDFIFHNIGLTNKYYVEFGFNTDSWGGTGPNAMYLHEKGWKGLLLDGEFHNDEMNLHAHFLYGHNIAGLFQKYNVPQEPDYVSVDVDSIDVWLLNGILEGGFRPRLFSVEFNANLPFWSKLVFPISTWKGTEQHMWDIRTCFFGNAAGAINYIAQKFNYTIIAREGRLDLFLLRNDLLSADSIAELTRKFDEGDFPFDSKKISYPVFAPLTLTQLRGWMDVEVYDKTGDADASNRAAWEHIWRDLRPVKSQFVGISSCFSEAWDAYEEKYGTVKVGEVPEIKS